MCGIGAIINGNVEKITELMTPIKTRGESYNEHKIIGNTIISCNRLKITGRKTGKQPIHNERIYTVFNGEIYNYEELKIALEQKGYIFQTETDTEILIHGYEEWGEKLPNYLDGQFSFIIYNKQTKEYFAARDHFGIKPLYFAKENSTTYIASELKQLINFSKEIEEVLPGHYIKDGTISRYYKLENKTINDSFSEIKIKIRKLLDNAVKKRCNTDLPIAVFFSGGIDSTSVLAAARRYHKDVTAILIGKYWESENSDYKIGIQYCKENGIPVIVENPPTEDELFNDIEKIVGITESFEPNMIKQAGLSLHMAKIAKENGFKIVLCGEGADEIFGGYPEFTNIPLKDVKNKSFQFFNNLYKSQLQRVDRTSMQHTVEVRVPFMDKELVEYGICINSDLKIKGTITKYIFREAMEELPKYIVERKKVVLSEGMGLKGNCLISGMFTEKINNLKSLSNSESRKYKLTNAEENYYFSIYKKFQYTNLKFTGRTTVNKINSTDSALLNIFNRFSRDTPHKISIHGPIHLVGFWGIGNKEAPDNLDIKTIDYVDNMLHLLREQHKPGAKFTFIIADSHGEMNGFPKSSYGEKISELLLEKGFKIVKLSSLWKKYGISPELIQQELDLKENDWWSEIPHKETLLENAKHNQNKNPEDAAKFYLVMRELEKDMLKKEFPSHIFQTYSDSKISRIFPDMPRIHMYARKRWSNVSWFKKE